MAVVRRQNMVGVWLDPEVQLDRRRRRLSSVVKRHAPQSRPYIVSVHRRGQTLRPTDDTVRMRATWSQTLVGADDVIIITQLPLGPPSGGGGNSQAKQIGGALALVALTVALPYALPLLAPTLFVAGGFLTAAATAGIVVGAAYLIGKATAAKANAPDDNRPLYGVSGGGNLPRPGDRIPSLYGRCWTQPDLSQADYSVNDGEDQVLYKRATVSLGKLQIHKIGLGAATLWTEGAGVVAPFLGALGGAGAGQLGAGIGGGASGSGGGTQVEIINPGGTSSLVPASVYSSPSVGGTELPRVGESPAHAGPFRASPVGRQTDTIQLDYSLSGGASHGDGAAMWGYQFEVAPCDDDDNPTGAWVPLAAHSEISRFTRAQRFTAIQPITMGDYIVRGQNLVAVEDGVQNAITWDGLRSHYAETIVRPHVTEIALKIRSGKSLGVTAFGDLWVEATRILPTWNGAAWVDAPTRKAVYAYKDILQADYGAGLADGQVDLDRIKFYAGSLSEFDTFDGVIRGPVSVWEAAATVLGPMRGEPARIANTWSINRDEPRAIKKHVITRRQIVRNTTAATIKIARDDGAADVIAEYAPGGDPRRRREVRVTFGAQSLTPSRVQLRGVADHEHAYHLATWKAAAAYLRRERRKLTLDRRGRIISRGDPALIDAWFLASESTRAGGVMARSGLILTLDTPMIVGDATYAMLRDKLNRAWGPVKVTAGAAANKIVLDTADVAAAEGAAGLTLSAVLAAANQEMTTVLVGPLTELQDGYLIDAVQPQGRDRVAIEAVFDHPGVWDALGEAIPPAPPIPSQGDAIETAVTVLPWVRARCVQKGVSLEMEWAVGPARGAATNTVWLSYDAGASWETVSNDLSTSGTYALRHVEGVAVKVVAFAVNRFGVPGPAVYTTFITFKPAVNSDTSDLLAGYENLAAVVRRRLAEGDQARDDLVRQLAAIQIQAKFADYERRLRSKIELDTVDKRTGTRIDIVSQTVSDNDGEFAAYQIFVAAQLADINATSSLLLAASASQAAAFSAFQLSATASLASLSASVSTQGSALTTLTSSVSTLSSTTTASINSLTASVTTNQTAIATISGQLIGMWGVKVDVNGHASSLQLISSGTVGAFVVGVDYFQIASPSINGGAGKTVYQIGTRGGVADVVMKGNMVVDGAIITTSLFADSATYDRAWNNPYTYSHALSGSGGTTHFGDSTSHNFTIVNGTMVQLYALVTLDNPGGHFNVICDFYVDGGLVNRFFNGSGTDGGGPIGASTGILVQGNMAPGAHSMFVRVTTSATAIVGVPSQTINVTNAEVIVFEPRTPNGA